MFFLFILMLQTVEMHVVAQYLLVIMRPLMSLKRRVGCSCTLVLWDIDTNIHRCLLNDLFSSGGQAVPASVTPDAVYKSTSRRTFWQDKWLGTIIKEENLYRLRNIYSLNVLFRGMNISPLLIFSSVSIIIGVEEMGKSCLDEEGERDEWRDKWWE